MTPSALFEALSALHLLRPHWLWALLALPLLAWWWLRRRRREGVWQPLVDPHLLPHLLEKNVGGRAWLGLVLALLAYALAVLALAGPSWRQTEQPLWRSRTPLVIALDLSSAALASDLPPSRLAQARAKIATLLRERKGGQVGLVAYADDAYTVAPLTEDAANLALFLDALAPEVMPVDGQRGDRAIAWSARLLRQAKFERGQILLLTDRADTAARSAAKTATGAGFRVSALGLGTDEGASYRRADGAIVSARLDAASLRALSAAGGGRYAALTPGDEDLRSLGVLDPSDGDAGQGGGERARTWQDGGYWLLPPLMLLALFAFRRHGATALLLCVLLPWQPARAVDWWRRADQTAHARLEQGAKAYRQADYAEAARRYGRADSADAHYNRGNALAKAGQYPQAVAAYDEALERQPGMADALANKRAVEEAMKRQPQGGSKDGRQNPQSSQGQQGSSSPQDGRPQSASSQDRNAQSDSSQRQQAQREPSQSDRQRGQSQQAKPADAQAQQVADAAQRERMQRALQGRPQAGERRGRAEPANETPQQRERRLANEAWLRRVPDDPGGLLREKFRIEYQRRQSQGGSGE